MGLKEYKAKRNFGVTAEPAGGKPLPKAVQGASSFVIQKHDATRLHYDFRLEMEGSPRDCDGVFVFGALT